jgi:hypothetical protein
MRCARYFFQAAERPWDPRAACYDRGHLPADKIARQSQQPIWLISRPAILDGDVPALDKSGVVEALPERIDEIFEAGSRCAPEKSHHRQRWLLRARRQWPRYR